jgi:GNAT superfamily N-acetyltransferase
VTVRVATPADVTGIGVTSLAAGQPDGADREYVQLLLDTATVFVAEDGDGTIAGWGAVRDGVLGSLLTDLFVHPDRHGRGIGGALLHRLWPDPDAGGRFTFASQHANALPLYARAGLQPSWPLLYLRGSAADAAPADLTVDDVSSEVAARADADLVGGDRTRDYAFWTRAGGAVLVRSGDRVVAAGVLDGGQVIHVACPDPGLAAGAIEAVLHRCPGEVSVCLPGPHPAVIGVLRSGFRVLDYDIAMSTPGLALPTSWVYSPALS